MAIEKLNLSNISMLIVVFPLSVFILSAINIKVKLNISFIDEVKSSLNDYPIYDLSYDVYCNGKSKANLYTFPGSKIGCSCTGVSKYRYGQIGQYEINPGKCDYNQSLNGCIDINEISGKDLSLWGNGNFCYKKYESKQSELKGYLLMLNNSALENEECEKGYKKCGKLDDMGNYLCIKEDDDCPINDIKVTVSQQPDLEKLNYSYILINNKFFYYSNTSEKPVVTNLEVTEEGKLCVDKSNIYTKYPQYILDNNFQRYGCRNKINGELYEKDIEVLDTRTKKQLYNDSNIDMDSLYNSKNYEYPFYSLEANMALYPKRYLGFDKKCLLENGIFDIENSPLKDEKIQKKVQITNDVLFINNYIKWLSIISILIELIACGICNLGNLKFKILIYIWILVNFLIYISLAVPISINVSNINKISGFFICGNNLMNRKIDYYHSGLNILKNTTIISSILLNGQIAFIIVIIILRFIIAKKFEKLNNQPLITKNTSSNIDYNKCPEAAYYDTPGTDQNQNVINTIPSGSEDNYTPKIENQVGYTNY